MTGFLELMDWPAFRRRNLNGEIELHTAGLTVCACGDEGQAVVWLLRTDALAADGRLREDAPPLDAGLRVPGLAPGRYSVVRWDTRRGAEAGRAEVEAGADGLVLTDIPVATDLALAIRLIAE
jgi:mannan endo-1,4-beta-mannosidase